jgi:hypothetical protein
MFRLLRQLALRAELRRWDDAIEEEVERHASFQKRMQLWRAERALVRQELDRVSRRANSSSFLSGLRRITHTRSK